MPELSDFTRGLIAAHRARSAFAPDGPLPATAPEAYAVHRALTEAVGSPAGFKISGAPGPGRTMAPIPAPRLFDSGARVPVPGPVGLELEVAFQVVGPLPAPEDAEFEMRLRAAVRPAAVIELVAQRLTGPAAEQPFAKLADLQANEALICGTPLEGWDGRDFGSVETAIAVDGTGILSGPATVPHGSAFDSLAALVRMVGGHCGGLGRGQWVLTGSLHPIAPVRPGQHIEARVDGLGTVTLTLGGPD